jgi:hypothetical protein
VEPQQQKGGTHRDLAEIQTRPSDEMLSMKPEKMLNVNVSRSSFCSNKAFAEKTIRIYNCAMREGRSLPRNEASAFENDNLITTTFWFIFKTERRKRPVKLHENSFPLMVFL